MAASLLASSTVVFSNGAEQHYSNEDTKLICAMWVDEEQAKASDTTKLPQLGTEDKRAPARYTGVVFVIEGKDLRLRSRAYPGHKPEDFPEYVNDGKCIYPKGEMRLALSDAWERKLIYDRLMKIIRDERSKHE